MDLFAFIDRESPDIPSEHGVEEFEAAAISDGAKVSAWGWRPSGDMKGTLFRSHGVGDHSRNVDAWTWWLKEGETYQMGVVGIDLRHHGRSSDRYPSFGTGESWDIRGVMDKAEDLGFPKPFVIIGSSLSSMGSQRAAMEDERITGCFLVEPPQCPWHAIGSTTYNFLPKLLKIGVVAVPILGQLINAHYGWDVLSDGDIRNHDAPKNPSHEPLLMFVMGENDSYEVDKTRMVYDYWYSDRAEVEGHTDNPLDEKGAKKWFVRVPNAGHGGEVYGSSDFGRYLDSFIRRCLNEKV